MLKEKLEEKVIKFYEDELLGIKDQEGKLWLGVNKTCQNLGFNEADSKNQVTKINKDIILSNFTKVFNIEADNKNGVIQKRKILFLNIKALPIWLSSINKNSLNEKQYEKIIKLLNWSLSDEFDNFKTPTKIYSFESELRDDIYNQGYFLDIKITNKETSYEFGRTDLEGIDKFNNKCCIELKKYSSMNYTIDQLSRYKNSNKFDRVVYCSYIVDDELKKWCETHSIEYYIYNRELIISKNTNEDVYFGLLDDIENLKYGLENFEEKENFYPTLKDTIEYKENIIKSFYKYKNNALEYKQANDIKNLYKILIVIYYIKFSYVKALDSDFDKIFIIDDIDEVVDLYSDGFKNYLLGYGY